MLGVDVDTLSALAKLLFDGVAIILIFLLYINITKNRENERKTDRENENEKNNKLQENYTKLVEEIIKGIAKEHLTPSENKNVTKIEKEVNKIINQVLVNTNASRVGIVKYHNGNRDMLGTAFLKMSMTNEVVNLGVAPMMPSFRDMFRSLLFYWCHELEIKNEFIVKNTENLKELDTTMYQYLKVRNIQAEYSIAIHDLKGNIIGFMFLEFLDKDNFNIDKIKKSVSANLPKIEALTLINGGEDDELQ